MKMWNLTREEQGVLLFILAAVLVGMGVKLVGVIPYSQVTPSPDKLIKVKISGAVKEPDWYNLPEESLVIEAVRKAGGVLPQADLKRLNLSSSLKDGEEIRVPGDKININSASVDELTYLPGIGPVLAQRIIEYREKNGDFKDPSELMNVPGIGEKKLAQIKGKITLTEGR